MPYPLPDGDAFTDELLWFLVAVPDKPEYVRAAMGAYTQFTKWWIWERDELKRGADAADAWDIAVEETLRAWEMSLIDTLIAAIDNVEPLLQLLIDSQCCDTTGFQPSDFLGEDPLIAPTDDFIDQTGGDVVRDVGDPPASSTWAAYDTALCAEATAFIDETLPTMFDIIEVLSEGITTVGILFVTSVAAAIVAVTGIALPAVFLSVGYLTAAVELINSLINGEDTAWDTYKSEIAADRTSLICAIVQQTTAENAALSFRQALAAASPKGYDWVRSTLPIDWFIRRMFNEDTDTDGSGGFGGPGGDCDCTITYDYLVTWDTAWTNFSMNTCAELNAVPCGGDDDSVRFNPNAAGCTVSRIVFNETDAIGQGGYGGVPGEDPKLIQLEIVYECLADWAGDMSLEIFYQDGTSETHDLPDGIGEHTVTFQPVGANKFLEDGSTPHIWYQATGGGANSPTNQVCIRSVRHWYTYDPEP